MKGKTLKETSISTCSESVKTGIKWLEDQMRFDREELERKLKSIKEEYLKEDVRRRLKTKYLCGDALEFYILSKVNSYLLKEFLEASKNEEFWLSKEGPYGLDEDIVDDPYLLWYLAQIGLGTHKHFKEAFNKLIKELQTIKGEIHANCYRHAGPLRILVLLEPESEATSLAVKFFLDNLDYFRDEIDSLAIGMLALSELDFLKYDKKLKELGNELKKEQKKEGYIGKIWQFKNGKSLPIIETSLAIMALSRIFGHKDEGVISAVKWLKNIQKDGIWEGRKNTAYACLALMSVGEGPMIPFIDGEWREMLIKQKLERTKPHFIHTSPNVGITKIKEKISEMLKETNQRFWICSRFITEFWTDIISLKRKNPTIDIRIITIPRKEMKGGYKGEGKKFVDPAFDTLQKSLGKNFKTTPILHARLVIADDEVLVSSADISSEQLEKEFNAGIWTKDGETVKKAIEFFENIWRSISLEKEKEGNNEEM